MPPGASMDGYGRRFHSEGRALDMERRMNYRIFFRDNANGIAFLVSVLALGISIFSLVKQL